MDLAQAAPGASALALMGPALVLGVRHGIDWDHIAAITDIASATTAVERSGNSTSAAGHRSPSTRGTVAASAANPSFGHLELRAVGLASLYALGHALVVCLLGLAALYFQAILPDWIDPIMERVVGVTLLVLGAWVFYSLVRYWRGADDFRLQSRWMLVFAGARYAWMKLRSRLHGHAHEEQYRISQYGARSAFGVGMIHGIGAETGSQVLIIAAVGGAASEGIGVLMMLAFVVGLLISNTLIALLSSTGFISSSRARTFYVAVGCLAGLVSLWVGAYFVLGAGDQLPDLQHLISLLVGPEIE
jgi:hypothetical protein